LLKDSGSIEAVTALAKLFGTQYEHGNIGSTICNNFFLFSILYQLKVKACLKKCSDIASGNSVDWTFDKAKILYSYAVELRDQGEYGFILPPDQIIPSGLETFEAVKALALYIKSHQATK
jgi:hypothetical protein